MASHVIVKPLRLLLPIALCAVVAACSMPRLGYQNIDHLIRWKANDYVSLNRQQSRLLKSEIRAQHAWHCHLDLPRYRPLMITARQAMLNDALTAEDIYLQAGLWKDEIGRTATRVIPGAVEISRTLDSEQIEELFGHLDRANDELHERYLAPDEEQQISERSARMQKKLEQWLGRLNEHQTQRIEQWAIQPADRNALWLQNRQHWQQALRQALDTRYASHFPDELARLLMQPQSHWLPLYRAQQAQVTEDTIAMLLGVLASGTPEQRNHLRGAIDDLLGDLEKVRCPSLPENRLPPTTKIPAPVAFDKHSHYH